MTEPVSGRRTLYLTDYGYKYGHQNHMVVVIFFVISGHGWVTLSIMVCLVSWGDSVYTQV